MNQRRKELSAWLRLALIPGIGGTTQRKLLKHFGSPEEIFASSYHQVSALIDHKKARLLFEYDNSPGVQHALSWSEIAGQCVLTLADKEYPQMLLSISDPPNVIYVQGNLEALNPKGLPSLAIVGSRHASPQGLKIVRDFARELSKHGITIISGLALGIDAEAHRGALDVDGSTIAIIGTGADQIYPLRNKELAMSMLKKGAIITEFPLATPAIAANFPRRNRLISGMAQGVLVVEATMESGSLITARMAAEQGREVFAIPGSIHSPFSRGCHKLIKQGAKLVETTQDILEELGLSSAFSGQLSLASINTKHSRNSSGLSKGVQARNIESAENQSSKPGSTIETQKYMPSLEEQSVIEAIGSAPSTLDDIAHRTGKGADVLLRILLSLEMAGVIRSLPGNQYQCIG